MEKLVFFFFSCYNLVIEYLERIFVMTVEELHRVFTQIPRLETDRLILRKILPIDASAMYSYSSSDEVTKYLLWYKHENLSYTQEYIDYLQERYAVGDFYDWAILLRENEQMIGTCGFTNFDLLNNCAEIGYVLHPEHHGKGYATEAACRVIRFGFENLKLSRISAICMQENLPSLGVMRRCGMLQEGILRSAVYAKGKRCTVAVCAITEEDYFKKNPCLGI